MNRLSTTLDLGCKKTPRKNCCCMTGFTKVLEKWLPLRKVVQKIKKQLLKDLCAVDTYKRTGCTDEITGCSVKDETAT